MPTLTTYVIQFISYHHIKMGPICTLNPEELDQVYKTDLQILAQVGRLRGGGGGVKAPIS